MPDPGPSLKRRLFERLAGARGRALGDLPGPEPTPVLGNVAELAREPRAWRLLGRWTENHGPLCVFWVFSDPTLLLSDPELIAEVLEVEPSDEPPRFYKRKPILELGPVLTVSSLVSNRRLAPTPHRVGDYERAVALSPLRWVHERLPSGQRWFDAQPAAVHRVVEETVLTLLEECERPGTDFDLLEAMRRLTWDSLSVMAVGKVFEDPAEDRYADFWTLVGYGEKRLRARGPMPRAPGSFDRAFVRWTKTFDDLVDRARADDDPERGDRARDDDDERTDLLTLAVRGGCELSDRELAWEIGNIWFGGQMGVASTLVSTLYYLQWRPDWAREVVRELRERLGERPAPSWEALESCRKLDAAVREAQRLVPPVPLFFRNSSAFEEVELAGRRLPRDTQLLISSWALQRDPTHWERPEHYYPERWLDDAFRLDNDYGTGRFFPFGRGPRTCGGEMVARLCTLSVLAALLRRARVSITDPTAFAEELFATVLSLTWLRARVDAP